MQSIEKMENNSEKVATFKNTRHIINLVVHDFLWMSNTVNNDIEKQFVDEITFLNAKEMFKTYLA